MSAFATIAQESADDQNTDAGVAVPEEETATAAVSEATADAQDVAQEDADAEQLNDEQDELSDVEEAVAQESEGLTPQAAAMLNIALKNIVGKTHANKIIATENYSSSRGAQREAKQIALEGIKETLKRFWDAIKAQLKKFYNKVKSFFVKVFSAARKLGDRAKKLQQKANDTVGTIEEKSFSFGQTKTIAVDGKYNEPGSLTTGLSNIRKWIDGNITVKKSDDYENIIEKAQSAVEKAVKSLGSSGNVTLRDHAGVMKELTEGGHLSIAPLSTATPEPKLADMFSGGKDSKDSVQMSQSLPGGKAIFKVVAKGDGEITIDSLTKRVKNSRLILGNDKYNPRDVSEGDVKTLTTSQIDKVCDDVIEIAETSYTYEKAWEKRDKFQAKLEREIDAIVKDVNSDNEDKNDSRADRIVRDYATAFTTSVRRRTTFESQFISYALNVGSAMLNYSERSLAQHKAK